MIAIKLVDSVWRQAARMVTLRSMAKTRLVAGDQVINGLNLIGKATLNVLEPGGRHEMTAG